jgi:hypothetical protein
MDFIGSKEESLKVQQSMVKMTKVVNKIDLSVKYSLILKH